MRRTALLLALASAAVAQDSFPATLSAFEDARKDACKPGAGARVFPAVEQMVATKDLRAILPLAAFAVETMKKEKEFFDRILKVEAEGVAASGAKKRIERELKLLRLQEKRGGAEVGPAIEKRYEEQREANRTIQRVRFESTRISKMIDHGRKLRRELTRGCGTVLAALKGADAMRGIAHVRQSLRPDGDQGLYLVHILRDSALVEAASELVEIAEASKALLATRRQAIRAIARLNEPKSLRKLVDMWEREPEKYAAVVRDAMGIAAKRHFATSKDAREWVKSLTP